MGLWIFSTVGLPILAIGVFVVLEAAFSRPTLWACLSGAGIDVCRVSVGITGALFHDVQFRASGTVAAGVLLLELMLAGGATIIQKRATDLGIVRQSTSAFGILGFGIVSLIIPTVLIILSRGH